MHIVAWVARLFDNEKLKNYVLMQCIKESSTLSVSSKLDKPSPRIVFRYGRQDREIKSFLKMRDSIKELARASNEGFKNLKTIAHKSLIRD